jgi:hypothetical protein
MNWTDVSRLLEEMKQEFEGLHKRINEIEALRYYEDKIGLDSTEAQSGAEIRVGLTAEMIENIKAALTTNIPRVSVKPMRRGDPAQTNSSTRELFHNQFIRWINKPIPMLNELADAQGGLGVGIVKAARYLWPKNDRKRIKGESDSDYLDRQEGLKRLWGPPLRAITIHPLTYYFRLGAGNQIAESIENSYKPRRQVYRDFSVAEPVVSAPDLTAVVGQPLEIIRPLPYGMSTETMALCTEYWSPDLYQIYVDGRLVFEEKPPHVKYFLALGRTSSSKDPDKLALSVAEILRHNEPSLNRVLTRMAEAAELIVRRRNTLEVPEGYTPEELMGEDNNPVTKTWEFKADKAEALPAGAHIVDPFAGVESVYAGMPFINLLLQLLGQHGISPLLKGVPPGAVGSGYRDNSLYLMAKSQFQYLLDSYSNCIVELLTWVEGEIVDLDQEVWVGEHKLSKRDIKEFPAIIEVAIEPLLPQNIIAEGQFMDRMHDKGHVTRRRVREDGLKIEQPEQEGRDRMIEDLQTQLLPILYQDVLEAVGIVPPQLRGNGGQPGAQENPMAPAEPTGPGGVQQLMAEGGGEGAQISAGEARGGQPRMPPEEAGQFPPGLE